MNAHTTTLIPHDSFADSGDTAAGLLEGPAIDVSDRDAALRGEPAPLHGPGGEGHSILTARVQAAFLEHLQHFGNVRLACRTARISAQTAYRGRRRSSAFAQAWDAALLAANPEYPAIELREGQELTVWGVVTYVLHNARRGPRR